MCTRYTNHRQYVEILCDHLTRWLKRKSRRFPQHWLEAALILIRLDLDPAGPILQPLYSQNPRGRHPYDPKAMLRSLILMLILGYDSISKWAKELKTHPRLAIIAGFKPFQTPAVGTFYLFIDRLEDGTYQKPCHHRIKPSSLRKGKHLRNLQREKEQRKKKPGEYDPITQKLKEKLIDSEDQSRPDDLIKRLEDILIRCAVIPSAERGLLGKLSNITISGDGSALPSAANPNGTPSCNCRKEGIYHCEHDRFYSNPTANWGYDPYRDCYFFGHNFYQHIVPYNGHDLPLQVSIAPASETDFTLSIKSLDRIRKTLREHNLNWNITKAVYDSGHDALGIYEYLLHYGITPLITLNPRAGEHPSPTGNAKRVDEEGIPICPAGIRMRKHHHNKQRHRTFYNCPIKRPSKRDGKHLWLTYPDECPLGSICQPNTKMGPVLYVKTSDDPRLYPSIPRDSKLFRKLMNLRSGCERSNSTKKQTYKLKTRPSKSDVHYLVRLYLISLIEHAKAWLAEDKKLLGDDPFQLIDQIMA